MIPFRVPILLLLAFPACGGGSAPQAPAQGELHRPGMANPASVYCKRLGGRFEIRSEGAGQSGYCLTPDGRTVEEWELYRDAEPL